MSNPTSPPANFTPVLGSELAETLGLSWLDYYVEGVDLSATLVGGGPIRGTVRYQCPPDYDFIVLRIDPLLRVPVGSAPNATSGANLGRLQGMKNRMRLLASGIAVDLVSETRKNERILNFVGGLGDDGSADPRLRLGDLAGDMGGPFDLLANGDYSPLFLKRGERIRLDVETLADITDTVVAGLTFWGVMVSAPKR